MLKVEEINVTIRKSRREDMVQVFKLIKALAEFEKLEHTITIDAEMLAHDGFDRDHPAFTCLVAELSDGHIMGYALYYTSYSTWLGTSIFLEDLYVQPAYRRNGIGRQLFMAVAKIAHETHSQRMEFHVLSWNPAIDFYKSLGATDMTVTDRWHHFRIDKPSLDRLFAPPDRPHSAKTPTNNDIEAQCGRKSLYSGRCSLEFTTKPNNHFKINNRQSAPPNYRMDDSDYNRLLNNCSQSNVHHNNQAIHNSFNIEANDYDTHSNNNDRLSVHSNIDFSTNLTNEGFKAFLNNGRESTHSNEDRFSTHLSDSHYSIYSNLSAHSNYDSNSIQYRSETPYSAYDGRFSVHLNDGPYSNHCDDRQSTHSAHI